MTAKISASGALTEMTEVEDDNVDGAELKGMLVCTPTADPSASGACTLPDVLIDRHRRGRCADPDPGAVHRGELPGPRHDGRPAGRGRGRRWRRRQPRAPSISTLVAIQSEEMCQANDQAQRLVVATTSGRATTAVTTAARWTTERRPQRRRLIRQSSDGGGLPGRGARLLFRSGQFGQEDERERGGRLLGDEIEPAALRLGQRARQREADAVAVRARGTALEDRVGVRRRGAPRP